MNELREKFDAVRERHAAVKAKLDDPNEYYENFNNQMADVVEDMGWILENFCTPGMMVSAMSIANHARRLEREYFIAMLEAVKAKEEAEDGEIRKRLGPVALGSVTGTLQALIDALKELP